MCKISGSLLLFHGWDRKFFDGAEETYKVITRVQTVTSHEGGVRAVYGSSQ